MGRGEFLRIQSIYLTIINTDLTSENLYRYPTSLKLSDPSHGQQEYIGQILFLEKYFDAHRGSWADDNCIRPHGWDNEHGRIGNFRVFEDMRYM